MRPVFGHDKKQGTNNYYYSQKKTPNFATNGVQVVEFKPTDEQGVTKWKHAQGVQGGGGTYGMHTAKFTVVQNNSVFSNETWAVSIAFKIIYDASKQKYEIIWTSGSAPPPQ